MNNGTFFDLREFMITILKRTKLCVILITVCILGGVLFRFIPLVVEYTTYKEPTIESNQETFMDFPYEYQARRTLYIKPQYKSVDGIVVDETDTIVNAYLACYQNKEILQPLVEEYYTEAANDFSRYNEKLVRFNYRTKSVLEEMYVLNDFYGIVTIKVVGNTGTEVGNYISIYATTGSGDLSESIVAEAEKLINSYVENLVGEYSYTITEGQLGQLMPQATSGLVPKTLTSGKTNVSTRQEMPYIIKRSIKGGIWGLAGGMGLSVLLCFFFHCISLNIATEDDLKAYAVPVLVSIKLKSRKHFLGFIDRWIDALEGNSHNCHSYDDAGKLTSAYIRAMETLPFGKIVITGAGHYEELQKFAEQLEEQLPGYTIVAADTITTSADTVEKVSNSLGTILFESIGYSGKQTIQKEILHIEQLGKKVYGIVLEK